LLRFPALLLLLLRTWGASIASSRWMILDTTSKLRTCGSSSSSATTVAVAPVQQFGPAWMSQAIALTAAHIPSAHYE
jgi:hypothetical protein